MGRDSDQLLTRATGSGVLVQISFKAIKRVECTKNVKLKFVRLSVVVAVK